MNRPGTLAVGLSNLMDGSAINLEIGPSAGHAKKEENRTEVEQSKVVSKEAEKKLNAGKHQLYATSFQPRYFLFIFDSILREQGCAGNRAYDPSSSSTHI
jgi:hypothetical protein